MTRTCLAGLALAAILAGPGIAAACDVDKSGYDLTTEEAAAVYRCIAEDLATGYAQGAKRWIPSDYVSGYRDWTQASTAPAAPGFHDNRFLMTWVNETGAAEYTKFLAERGPMPAGTLIAKESFSVSEDGTVSKGPLFLMEKVAVGASPETGDWYYMMVSAGGVPQAVDVVTACAVCHQGNFAPSDGMGYPVPEVRASAE